MALKTVCCLLFDDNFKKFFKLPNVVKICFIKTSFIALQADALKVKRRPAVAMLVACLAIKMSS